MMKAFRAYKYVLENFGEETVKRLAAQVREEGSNRPMTVDDDRLDPDVARVLRTHGCGIENHTEFHRVIFPQGTSCELLIRSMSSHYLLTLPSGLKVKQIEKANRNFSLVYIAEGQNDATNPDSTRDA